MRRWLIIVLKFGITVLILSLFAWQLDLRPTARALSTISPYAIIAAIVAVLAVSLAAAGRLVLMVAGFGRRFPLGNSYRVTLESMFFSQTFISFLGGGRVAHLANSAAGVTSGEGQFGCDPRSSDRYAD
jgi:uncharacterized membrane protein YbhN (UPF0104 family)